MARHDLTGVLLVGGASRRFGSPKAYAELEGETLAARAWRLLGEVCNERIAVGKASNGLELPFPVLDDGSWVRAPLAGVVAGLRAARNELCVVLPVDTPLVTAAMLRRLTRAGGDAAVPQTGPLPGAYARSALAALERRLGEGILSLHEALRELETRVVELDRFLLANVNTLHDLATAARRGRVLVAAVGAAHAHGIEAQAPTILQDWNDTIVHLAPAPVVARVSTSLVSCGEEETCARELEIAAHAIAAGGPVVPPSSLLPPGPHRADGLTITFWDFVVADPEGPEPRTAGKALRALHDALADYPEPLPRLDERLDRAARVLAAPSALPELAVVDRELLARSFGDLRATVAGFAAPERVLHGGAHSGNLLKTSAGLRWIDLDTVCRGPLEWDLAHLPAEAAAPFPEADQALLATMRLLVSAEVAICCWHAWGRAPEVDEAAVFHLDRLRAGLGAARIVPFRVEHVAGFRRLVEDTLREFDFSADPELDADLADPLATYAAIWVAVAGVDVVGSVALRDLGGSTLELKRMYLRPGCRGQGLGRGLLETALDWAREGGARAVRLDTSERMGEARALYEAYGFRRVDGRAPRQGQQRLLYELELTGS